MESIKYYNLYDASMDHWINGFSTVKLSEVDNGGEDHYRQSFGRPWLLTKQQAVDWLNRDWGFAPPVFITVKELPEEYVRNYEAMLAALVKKRLQEEDQRRRLQHAMKHF